MASDRVVPTVEPISDQSILKDAVVLGYAVCANFTLTSNSGVVDRLAVHLTGQIKEPYKAVELSDKGLFEYLLPEVAVEIGPKTLNLERIRRSVGCGFISRRYVVRIGFGCP